MTAVLQLLQDIARHLDVKTTVTPEQLRDLMKKTDLQRLTNRMEELAEPATATAAYTTKAGPADGCGVMTSLPCTRSRRYPFGGLNSPGAHGAMVAIRFGRDESAAEFDAELLVRGRIPCAGAQSQSDSSLAPRSAAARSGQSNCIAILRPGRACGEGAQIKLTGLLWLSGSLTRCYRCRLFEARTDDRRRLQNLQLAGPRLARPAPARTIGRATRISCMTSHS